MQIKSYILKRMILLSINMVMSSLLVLHNYWISANTRIVQVSAFNSKSMYQWRNSKKWTLDLSYKHGMLRE